MLACCCSVKQYEAKLAALNAISSALQKENQQLREELADAAAPRTEDGESPCGLVCPKPPAHALPVTVHTAFSSRAACWRPCVVAGQVYAV